ncbi:hypothetical protein Tco_0317935 [Tanacetum coccineum]
MACCLLHNYIRQEMLIDPFKNKSECDEGTRDHEVAQEDDNITHVGTFQRGQEMLIGPFKNKSGCDEGTRDHEVAQEDDNITHVGTSNEWTSFRDNLAQSMFRSWNGNT